VPKELEGKFQTFLNVLEGKGFFTGLTKGTTGTPAHYSTSFAAGAADILTLHTHTPTPTEYQDRYNLAKQRFLSQYSSTQTTPAPAPAPAPAAVDPAAQLQEAEKFKALGTCVCGQRNCPTTGLQIELTGPVVAMNVQVTRSCLLASRPKRSSSTTRPLR
jgi:hypothetical protein